MSAMITGGGGDIGRATAKRLAEEGARIVLLDLDQQKLDDAKSELESNGAAVVTLLCDVTDYQETQRAVSEAISLCGRVELLFNNAGYQGDFAPSHTYDPADFARVMQINVTGAFHVLRAVSEHMVEAGGGAIVNTASQAGVGGPPNMIAYGASKSAVIGMTQTAAKDLAPHGIRVNAISPAYIGPGYMWDRQVRKQAEAGSQYFDSDPEVVAQQMIGAVPMRRYGSIEEIPGTVAYLLSEDASYVTGVNIQITGGIS